MNQTIRAIDQEGLKENVPQFNVGDTVKVSVKVIEGTRERLQAFEGVVIAKKNGRHQRDVYGEKNLVRRGRGKDLPRCIPRKSQISR